AYIQNGLKQFPTPLKLWTEGAMFRAENVHQGRLRQFHQVDYEVIGSADALVDAEAIWLMVEVVRELGLSGVQVKLGSIGDPSDRETYNAYLRELFTPHAERLSDDSKDRLTRNPMRILDSKSAEDQALIRELAVRPMLDFLGAEAADHFAEVQAYLAAWGVEYDLDPSIVRGLDYYRRTAWELHHEGVGAKSALGGGGRYDGLSAQLGGPEVPGIGWAFGIERLLLALEAEGVGLPGTPGPLLYLAAMDAENVGLAAQIALGARTVARVEFAYKAQKPGNAFKDAERRRARYAAVIGTDEAQRRVLNLKNLASGEQQEVALDDLNARLTELENN
ncbi:MAG: histidyl-tRNA synthase, partial [Deinococcus sp.]|nr:histidyl-tRNA synthase [Deinococcus sp.]